MIGLPAGTRIWIPAGVTDLRAGFQGLAAKVQTALEENAFDLVKILWATEDGLWLLANQFASYCNSFSWIIGFWTLRCLAALPRGH
jgi:hypothetical protein